MSSSRIVIAAVSDDTKGILSSIALETGLSDITVNDGVNLRNICAQNDYDIIVAVLPLADEFGADTISYLSKSSSASIIAFVPSKVYDEASAKLSNTGVILLPKSVPRNLIANIIKSADCQKQKLDELKNENKMLTDMLNETKLVNRAKCVLIEYLKISEKEAHRQIQKRAMDQRITLTEVASDILKTYEYR